MRDGKGGCWEPIAAIPVCTQCVWCGCTQYSTLLCSARSNCAQCVRLLHDCCGIGVFTPLTKAVNLSSCNKAVLWDSSLGSTFTSHKENLVHCSQHTRRLPPEGRAPTKREVWAGTMGVGGAMFACLASWHAGSAGHMSMHPLTPKVTCEPSMGAMRDRDILICMGLQGTSSMKGVTNLRAWLIEGAGYL